MAKKPGPAPKRLKITGDWEEAVRKAASVKPPETPAKRPAKPKPKKG